MESAEEKARRYISLTRRALEEVSIAVPRDSSLFSSAALLLDMTERYLRDAEYFLRRDPLTALAAASYAHAWLDAGVRLGLLKGDNPRLFMVEPKRP